MQTLTHMFSLPLCLGRAVGGKAGQEQLHHKGGFVPGQCNTRNHDPIDYILFKRQGYCQVPGPERSLWYLKLGLADVPALPTSREKDFRRLLVQLLAADFQVRFCPANCPYLTLQIQWSHENSSQISSIS